MLKSAVRISARSAGSTVLSMDQTEKFFTPASRAVRTAAAVPGAVVSKPTPRNTTSFSGFRSAMSIASIGEYTISTLAPRARRRCRLSPGTLLGTRSMSP